jgi:hypothetical protein
MKKINNNKNRNRIRVSNRNRIVLRYSIRIVIRRENILFRIEAIVERKMKEKVRNIK